ncbi:unnamed protein product [Ambrosiozyma monospora]|uniref:Unnamed protein product n=1 Tax=Ambrosiozyma monospora TaxID=43982 RepID=A0ACB5TGK6_AMBMO|nr:unnamed protein product [Ambrosiozyma monospora]
MNKSANGSSLVLGLGDDNFLFLAFGAFNSLFEGFSMTGKSFDKDDDGDSGTLCFKFFPITWADEGELLRDALAEKKFWSHEFSSPSLSFLMTMVLGFFFSAKGAGVM